MIVSKSKSWLLAMTAWSLPRLRREPKAVAERPARPTLLESWQRMLEAPVQQFVQQFVQQMNDDN